MKQELWEDILDFEDFYEASTEGNIRNKKSGRVLKAFKRKGGYLGVELSKGHKSYKLSVSRLVYSAFHGPIPKGMEVNHINQKRDDNRLENLNLLTHKENINWANGNALRGKTITKKQKKRVEQYTLSGIHMITWFSVKDVCEEFGYNQSLISKCCRGLKNNHTAYGFIWRYEKN